MVGRREAEEAVRLRHRGRRGVRCCRRRCWRYLHRRVVRRTITTGSDDDDDDDGGSSAVLVQHRRKIASSTDCWTDHRKHRCGCAR